MSFDIQYAHPRSQAPSIASLHILQRSVPATAATSMLTIVPADDEKQMEQAGPSSDGQVPNQDSEDQSVPAPVPQVALTFLLVSGSRRTMLFDPEAAVGRVKELVWNAWPSDWQDEKPPAPNYLRILYLGKILQDEDTLSGLSFPASTSSPPPTPTSPTNTSTIVHLSIRPYAPPTEDEATLKKKARAAQRALSRSSGSVPGAEPGAGGAEDGAGAGGCCGCIIC
ncbi:ubiquitin-related domain-containing protein [Phellopilus nigrolimitatus]|nr:ubiquitin-related domain-containing protein [Phellopilus nigrolimitatus]